MPMVNQGMTKLVEECGELIQIIAKKTAYPTGKYPTSKFDDIDAMIVEEMGDVLAALGFVADKLKLDEDAIYARAALKYITYKEWDAT